MKTLIAMAALIVVGLAAYAIFGVLEERTYMKAVTADARSLGFAAESIQYPAHWPLDFYATHLGRAQSPEAAESIVTTADSVHYFLTPVAANPADSLLVQTFYFRIANRVNLLQLSFSSNGTTQLNGTDWAADASWLTSRQDAVDWFHRAERHTSARP